MTELGVFLLVPMLAVAGASVAAWWRSTRQRPGARRARALPVTLECPSTTPGRRRPPSLQREPHRGRVR